MYVAKTFWDDPYLTELEAKVTSVDGDFVTVDRTIAYAFSGGQESDHGTYIPPLRNHSFCARGPNQFLVFDIPRVFFTNEDTEYKTKYAVDKRWEDETLGKHAVC